MDDLRWLEGTLKVFMLIHTVSLSLLWLHVAYVCVACGMSGYESIRGMLDAGVLREFSSVAIQCTAELCGSYRQACKCEQIAWDLADAVV